MKKKIISILMATLTLVLSASPIISEASESDSSDTYYSNHNLTYLRYADREELVIDNPDYQSWKDNFKPNRGQMPENDYSYLISFTEGMTEEDRLYTYCCMDKIPDKVINYLVEYGWKIELTDQVIYWDDGVSTVSAYTCIPEHKIFVSKSANSHDIRISLTHEIGHVVSLEMYFDELYDSGYFRVGALNNIYFHDNCCTNYICNSNVESLAQFFYEYVYYPFETDATMPELYNFYYSNLN